VTTYNVKNDDDETEKPDEEVVNTAQSSNRNISELLFHPANFEKKELKMMMRTNEEAVHFAEKMSKMDMSKMTATDFNTMMFDIQKIYKKINEKLQVNNEQKPQIFNYKVKQALNVVIYDYPNYVFHVLVMGSFGENSS
jgi:hypothetical protein